MITTASLCSQLCHNFSPSSAQESVSQEQQQVCAKNKHQTITPTCVDCSALDRVHRLQYQTETNPYDSNQKCVIFLPLQQCLRSQHGPEQWLPDLWPHWTPRRSARTEAHISQQVERGSEPKTPIKQKARNKQISTHWRWAQAKHTWESESWKISL